MIECDSLVGQKPNCKISVDHKTYDFMLQNFLQEIVNLKRFISKLRINFSSFNNSYTCKGIPAVMHGKLKRN